MPQAQTVRFGRAFVLIGDGATSEVFTAPCGFSELTMTLNIESNTVNIPDCDDPDLAAWLATDIVSQQMTLQGSGVLDTTAMQMWQGWYLDHGSEERNIRWFRDIPNLQGGGYFQAPGVMTAYEETGSRGQRWQLSVGLALNGKPTFTPAVA